MYWTLRKNIMKEKYNLFRLEKIFHEPSMYIGEFTPVFTQSCFEYILTFETLKFAQSAQKEIKQKTIIIPSY